MPAHCAGILDPARLNLADARFDQISSSNRFDAACPLRSGGSVVIRTADDYREALRRLSVWFDGPPEPGSDEGEAFEALLMRVAEYESEQFPI